VRITPIKREWLRGDVVYWRSSGRNKGKVGVVKNAYKLPDGPYGPRRSLQVKFRGEDKLITSSHDNFAFIGIGVDNRVYERLYDK
tara:strand:+ start:2555 stop:2809 length:255 start_codon:yes stop_codon:yes gene_type:complete